MRLGCCLFLASLPAAAQQDWLFYPPQARSRLPFRIVSGRAIPVGKPVAIQSPLGLPPVPFPPDNPPTAETIALGKKLFFEKMFSRDNTVACASCHDPKKTYADPHPFSEGVDKQLGGRHSPTVLNAAYNSTQFWDGRALTLEMQAEFPVQDPKEMAHSLVGVERRLSADADYGPLFTKAFGPGTITYEKVAKSIAAYERTLISGNSRFDRYYYGDDKSALSESEVRGLNLFMDLTLDGPNCISCHRIDPTHATFTEPRFHNTGVAVDPATGEFRDMGRYNVTNENKDTAAFRVPTLRNIALTAPYMHDGSMKTLEEVVDFYFKGGRANRYLSGVMPHAGIHNIPHDKQVQAKADLVAFMKALTGDLPADSK